MQINRKVKEGLYKKSFNIEEQTSLREKEKQAGSFYFILREQATE